ESPAPHPARGRAEDDAYHDGYPRYRGWGDRGIAQEVVEPDRDPLLEQHRDPEGRQGVQQEGQEDDAVVESLVLAQRAHDTDEHTEHDREDRGERDELERHDERRAENIGDGLVGPPGDSEVALADRTAGDTAEPREVAHRGGLVELEHLGALLDLGFFVG